MSGSQQQAKLAVGCPLDRRVRPRLGRSMRAQPEQPPFRSEESFWRRLRSGTSVDWLWRGAAATMELIMSSASDYGEHYWCVTGDGGSVFVYADRIEITA